MILRYLILCFLILPGAVFADAVRMRSGEIVVGTITGQTRDDLTINVNGRTRVIRKTEIQRVVYGSAEAELKKAEEQRRLWEEQKRQNEKLQADKDRASRPSVWGPVWKSALLPGAGQYASGHERIGIATGSLLGATALYAWHLRTNALSAKAAYDTTSTFSKSLLLAGSPVVGPVLLDDSAKQIYAGRVGKYNQSLNLLAVLYLAQIAHTYFLARPAPGAAGTSLHLAEVETARSRREGGLDFAWSFTF
jgi:hypothetical protein